MCFSNENERLNKENFLSGSYDNGLTQGSIGIFLIYSDFDVRQFLSLYKQYNMCNRFYRSSAKSSRKYGHSSQNSACVDILRENILWSFAIAFPTYWLAHKVNLYILIGPYSSENRSRSFPLNHSQNKLEDDEIISTSLYYVHNIRRSFVTNALGLLCEYIGAVLPRKYHYCVSYPEYSSSSDGHRPERDSQAVRETDTHRFTYHHNRMIQIAVYSHRVHYLSFVYDDDRYMSRRSTSPNSRSNPSSPPSQQSEASESCHWLITSLYTLQSNSTFQNFGAVLFHHTHTPLHIDRDVPTVLHEGCRSDNFEGERDCSQRNSHTDNVLYVTVSREIFEAFPLQGGPSRPLRGMHSGFTGPRADRDTDSKFNTALTSAEIVDIYFPPPSSFGVDWHPQLMLRTLLGALASPIPLPHPRSPQCGYTAGRSAAVLTTFPDAAFVKLLVLDDCNWERGSEGYIDTSGCEDEGNCCASRKRGVYLHGEGNRRSEGYDNEPREAIRTLRAQLIRHLNEVVYPGHGVCRLCELGRPRLRGGRGDSSGDACHETCSVACECNLNVNNRSSAGEEGSNYVHNPSGSAAKGDTSAPLPVAVHSLPHAHASEWDPLTPSDRSELDIDRTCATARHPNSPTSSVPPTLRVRTVESHPRIAFITAIYGTYERSCKSFPYQTVPADFICFSDQSHLPSLPECSRWDVDLFPYHEEMWNRSVFPTAWYTNLLYNHTHEDIIGARNSIKRLASFLESSSETNSSARWQELYNYAAVKFYKMCFYYIERLQKYDVVVWVDATIKIHNMYTAEIVSNVMKSDRRNIMLYEHIYGGSLYSELKYACHYASKWSDGYDLEQDNNILHPVMNRSRSSRFSSPQQNIIDQFNSYVSDGYNDFNYWTAIEPERVNYGLWITCFLAYNMRNESTRVFLSHWYNEIIFKTMECQLSFPYVAQMLGIHPLPLPHDESTMGDFAFNRLFEKLMHGL